VRLNSAVMANVRTSIFLGTVLSRLVSYLEFLSLTIHGIPFPFPTHISSPIVFFFIDLFSGAADSKIRVYDMEKQTTLIDEKSTFHTSPINALKQYSEDMLVTGDDEGTIKMWDIRQKCPVKNLMSFAEHDDFISDLWMQNDKNHVLATSGDCMLSVYDIRGKGTLEARSDDVEDELLSLAVIKNGRKVICGSQDGILNIFSYGNFGDISDRFPGHPQSIDAIVPIDDDTICTASCDGMIRLVQIQPNKLLGVIGEHGEFPIEGLRKSADNTILASLSHDHCVKLWDIRFLYEEDDDADDAKATRDSGYGSDDVADDSDELEDDEDMVCLL
jgi:WD repeat-containing protein 55